MFNKFWTIFFLFCCVFYYLSWGVRTVAATDFYISDEVTIDGPALFYGVKSDQRQELWSVYCAQPLRACVARAPGLVARIDEAGVPWLIAVTPPGARISIQSRNHTRDVSTLFNQPLDAETIRRLSHEKSFIVVEENSVVMLRTRTAGLDKVIDYLTWLRGMTARTLRDARLWPRNGSIRVQDMTPEVLERYQIMQRRALEAQKQLVPTTKPQVEFAIRAQDGESFYSAKGTLYRE